MSPVLIVDMLWRDHVEKSKACTAACRVCSLLSQLRNQVNRREIRRDVSGNVIEGDY